MMRLRNCGGVHAAVRQGLHIAGQTTKTGDFHTVFHGRELADAWLAPDGRRYLQAILQIQRKPVPPTLTRRGTALT